MLVEDTLEHREILGEDGNAVSYLSTLPQMIERAKWLVKHSSDRVRLAAASHSLITRGGNTYADRLHKIFEAALLQGEPSNHALRVKGS
jgi:hypothetical protein